MPEATPPNARRYARTPERAAALDRHPDDAVRLEPLPHPVVVEVAGIVVATSERAVLVRETAHEPVIYLPREDLPTGLLTPGGRRTRCPFKGDAAHHHVHAAGRRLEDAAWSYPAPLPEVAGLAGLVAFYPDRITVRRLAAPRED